MRQSQLFAKTTKTVSGDEVAKNAQLLIKAGYVYKEMAGVYAYLPLGLRVLDKLKQLIRQEMNAIDSSELIMTSLQRKAVWQQTGRWDDQVVDVWFKTQLKDKTELGLGWSHEEPIVEMLKQFVRSYKDLPVSVYQFQTKLRNELRAKSGVMRGREFVMKDMYSVHASAEDLDAYYQRAIAAYQRIFERLQIGHDTYVTFASGGAFTKFSHEFQTICEAGEDVIYLHRGKNLAINEEVLDEVVAELGIDKQDLEKVKTAEVGNIFNFGTQKTEEMGLRFIDRDGQSKPIYMGSYGIGITRLIGVLVEKLTDDKGLRWPKQVAPFQLHLVLINDAAKDAAEELYQQLLSADIEVLYDDRAKVGAGEKFADSDLMGLPYRVVVSPRLIERGEFELVDRWTGEVELLTKQQIIDKMKQKENL